MLGAGCETVGQLLPPCVFLVPGQLSERLESLLPISPELWRGFFTESRIVDHWGQRRTPMEGNEALSTLDLPPEV